MSEYAERRSQPQRAGNLKAYRAWVRMIHRTTNKNYPDYPAYGGRGIRTCDQWLPQNNGFENFLNHIGPPPSDKHSLDRYPDNDGGYEPGNVRWALVGQQANNRRDNVRLDFNGKSQTMAEWAKELGVDRRLLWKRITKLNWPVERALTEGFSQGKVAA